MSREDWKEEGVVCTSKIMQNGEVRKRKKYPSGVSISETTSSKWAKESKIPWQNAHYHRGLVEEYTLNKGVLVIVYQKNGSNTSHVRILRSEGSVITCNPYESHIVLLGPSTEISTKLSGKPVGNPSRKNNDWWPIEVANIKGAEKHMNKIESSIEQIFFS